MIRAPMRKQYSRAVQYVLGMSLTGTEDIKAELESSGQQTSEVFSYCVIGEKGNKDVDVCTFSYFFLAYKIT